MVMSGKLRSVRLQSVSDVNRYLSKVINMVNRDEMDPVKATKIGYLCNSLVSGLRSQDLEERVSKLERMVKQNGKS
jgi:hypothetical protein